MNLAGAIALTIILGIVVIVIIVAWPSPPEQSKNATVVAKEKVKKEDQMFLDDGNGGMTVSSSERMVYKMVFEVDGGLQLEFDVSSEVFDSFLRGDAGVLTYQAHQEDSLNRHFVAFKRTE